MPNELDQQLFKLITATYTNTENWFYSPEQRLIVTVIQIQGN